MGAFKVHPMSRVLLLMVAFAGRVCSQSDADEQCPHTCGCGQLDDYELTCSVHNNTVQLNIQSHEYMKVQCNNEAPTAWEWLPNIPKLRQAILPKIQFANCSPPSSSASYATALAQLGVSVGLVQHLQLLYEPEGSTLSRQRLGSFPGLRSLFVRGAASTVLQRDLFFDLPTLTTLRISETKLRLAVNNTSYFPDTVRIGLQKLELSDAGITEVPADAFGLLPSLETLSLWGNGIVTVADNAFAGLSNLQQLDLSSNELSTLPAKTLRSLPKLRKLILYSNRFQALPAGLLDELLLLENIELFDNIDSLGLADRQFAELTKLASVSLQRNGIRSLPEDLFAGSKAIIDLTLAKNDLKSLPSLVFRDQSALRRLDLSENKLETISAKLFQSLTSLEELILDGNRIQQFPSGMCAGLHSLLVLSAERGELRSVQLAALSGASRLRSLRLGRNALTLESLSLVGSDPDFDTVATLPGVSARELVDLDLSHNRISQILSDWQLLLKLGTLNLSHNRIEALEYGDVNFFSNNITVDLRYNNIAVLDLSRMAMVMEAGAEGAEGESGGATLLLDDNPLECSCALLSALRLARRPREQARARLWLRFGAARCASPAALAGEPAAQLDAARLECELEAPACPAACACVVRPARSELLVRCRSPPAWPALPDVRALRLDGLRLRLEGRPPRDLAAGLARLPAALRALDLSGLGLEELPLERLPSDLMEINLSHNNISGLEERSARVLLDARRRVTLDGNPLRCDCSAMPVLALLQERAAQIANFSSLTCADGAGGAGGAGGVGTAHASRLCGRAWAARAAAAGGGAALALAALLLLAWRRRRALRALLYARGCPLPACCLGLGRDDDDDAVKYDAFVSFSHLDEQFVLEHLVPRLELQHGLDLCVHHRDWRVGEPITAQIVDSVKNSRRTLVVLSNNFLSSPWGVHEFLTAYRRDAEAEEKRPRLVVVLLGEIATDGAGVAKEIAEYVAYNTYVKWGDPLFWDKLVYALRARRRRRPPALAPALAPAPAPSLAPPPLSEPSALATLFASDKKLRMQLDDKPH